ncbi:MAG: HAD-IIIA family hydrolase, partial [Candidatus Saccharimonadales bacterium]
MSNRAVFLDKDGTLIDDVPYNVDPEQIRLAPKAGVALRRLAREYRLFVVSNQAGVAHGYFGEDALPAVERRLWELLGDEGVALDGFYYCPHHPSGAELR